MKDEPLPEFAPTNHIPGIWQERVPKQPTKTSDISAADLPRSAENRRKKGTCNLFIMFSDTLTGILAADRAVVVSVNIIYAATGW